MRQTAEKDALRGGEEGLLNTLKNTDKKEKQNTEEVKVLRYGLEKN